MTYLLVTSETVFSTGEFIRDSVLLRESPFDKYDPTEDDRPDPKEGKTADYGTTFTKYILFNSITWEKSCINHKIILLACEIVPEQSINPCINNGTVFCKPWDALSMKFLTSAMRSCK